jgi:hypothetical protein
LPGFIEPSKLRQRSTPIGVRLGQARVDGQRHLEIGKALLEATDRGQERAAAVVCASIAGCEFETARKVGKSVVGPAHRLVQQAPIVQSFRIGGPQLKGAVEGRQGFARAPSVHQGQGAVEVQLGLLGRREECTIKVFQRLIVPTHLAQQSTAQGQNRRIARSCVEDGDISRESFCQLANLALCRGQTYQAVVCVYGAGLRHCFAFGC